QDLLALIDTLSPGEPVSAIGSSMGTGTLLHAVLAAPQRFDQLVLAAPPTAWQTRAAQADLYRAGATAIAEHGLQALAAAAASAPVPPVFAGLRDFPPAPDVAAELLPSIMRGAADSDLPAPERLRGIDQPVLVLAWEGDPGHPVSTAEELAGLIPGARLVIARTPEELAGWGAAAAAFLARPRG
ncbi:MAG: alpha/beta fold hydrolase, partial [Janthinobacterium lividum]